MIFAALTVDSHLKVGVLHFEFILETQQVLELVFEADDLVLDWWYLLLHLNDLSILGLKLTGSCLNEPVHLINFWLLRWYLKF